MSWLVIACLKNAVLALPLVAAALALGRFTRRPALAHVLWVLVLIKLITPPLIDVPLGWKFDVDRWLAEETVGNEAIPIAASAQRAEETSALAGASNPVPQAPVSSATASVPSWSPVAASQMRQVVRAASSWMQSTSWGLLLGLAGAAWLLGSATTAGLLYVRASRFQKYLKLACRDDERLTSRVRQLSYRTGLITYPKVIVVDGVVSPMLWGVGGGVRLLFPAKLVERLDAAETDALLLHELAHYSRGDYWVRLLELVTYVAYWWNPIVWWACRQIEAAEEQCCDAWVVEHQSGTRRSYAEALLATIDFLNEPAEVRPPAACGLGEVSLLKLRLKQIMRGELAAQMPRTAWLVVLLAGLALAPIEPALFATSSRFSEPAMAAVETPDLDSGPAIALSPDDIAPLIAAQSPAPVPTKSQPPAEIVPVSLPVAPPRSAIPNAFSPSRIYASVFSPNGRFKLDARIGRKTALTHLKTGWKLDLASHEIRCVSFSPDEDRQFVTGHKDGLLQIWDSETGLSMQRIASSGKTITSVAYSPDGTKFASGTLDGIVTVYDAATYVQVSQRKQPGGSVSCLRWSPSGDRLAIALGYSLARGEQGSESRLQIWTPNESSLRSDESLPQPAGALDWLSDDALLIADWDGQAIVRNVGGSLLPEQHYQVEKDLVSAANWSSEVRLVPSFVASKLAAGAGL
jgi:beta-lactamase regulating signal transducer with metallopeptidase domain